MLTDGQMFVAVQKLKSFFDEIYYVLPMKESTAIQGLKGNEVVTLRFYRDGHYERRVVE